MMFNFLINEGWMGVILVKCLANRLWQLPRQVMHIGILTRMCALSQMPITIKAALVTSLKQHSLRSCVLSSGSLVSQVLIN